MAGCSAFPGSREVAFPATPAPTYRRWLPEPSAVGPSGHGHYRITYRSLSDLREYANRNLSAFHRGQVEEELKTLGIRESAERMVSLSTIKSVEAHVVRGSYDADTVSRIQQESDFPALGPMADIASFGRTTRLVPSPSVTLRSCTGGKTMRFHSSRLS